MNKLLPSSSQIQEDELRIYHETFEVSSTIRKPKTLALTLQNKSDRSIEYEVIFDPEYLRPKNIDTSTKTFVLAPNADTQL